MGKSCDNCKIREICNRYNSPVLQDAIDELVDAMEDIIGDNKAVNAFWRQITNKVAEILAEECEYYTKSQQE